MCLRSQQLYAADTMFLHIINDTDYARACEFREHLCENEKGRKSVLDCSLKAHVEVFLMSQKSRDSVPFKAEISC